jgi:hypothetical protein
MSYNFCNHNLNCTFLHSSRICWKYVGMNVLSCVLVNLGYHNTMPQTGLPISLSQLWSCENSFMLDVLAISVSGTGLSPALWLCPHTTFPLCTCWETVRAGRALWPHLAIVTSINAYISKNSHFRDRFPHMNLEGTQFSPHIVIDFFLSFIFFIIFVKIYSLYRGEILVTILIRLILYIIYIAPIIPHPNHLPTPLKATARGFIVLFHIGIWSPSTI